MRVRRTSAWLPGARPPRHRRRRAGGGHHRRRVGRPGGADAAAARAAPAPEEPAPSVTGGVNVDLFSHYVWRGFALTDGFAFQPSVFVSTKGLTVTSWSSWSSTDAGCFDADDCPALREHDFTVDYTKPVGKATVSVGYINYLFPPYRTDDAKAADAVGVTNEIYGGVTFTAPGNPFVKAYVDVDGDEDEGDTSRGTYLQFGVSQPIPLAEGKATLTPMFSVGYNFKQWITENDWQDANLGVKVAIPGRQDHHHPGGLRLDRPERHGPLGRLRRPGGSGSRQVLRRRRLLVRVLSAARRLAAGTGPGASRYTVGRVAVQRRPCRCPHLPASSPPRPTRPRRSGRRGPAISSTPASPSGRCTGWRSRCRGRSPAPSRSAAPASPTGRCAGTRAAVADNFRGAFPDLSPARDRRADAAHLPQLLDRRPRPVPRRCR